MQMTVCAGLFSFSFSGNPGALLPDPSPTASPLFLRSGQLETAAQAEQGGPF